MFPPSESLPRAQLAQRLDAMLQQAQGPAAPQRAHAIGPVEQDPRQPSRAALDRQAQGIAPPEAARGARTLDLAPGTPAATQLSAAARVLAALVDPQMPQEPQPVRAAEPLWPHPSPPSAPTLARALSDAVEGSGLFYESHLQQFADGTRPLEVLQREPQARLAEQGAASAAPADQPATTAQAVLHPATVHIVQQQLHLLADGVWHWRGEPWPGTRMDWVLHVAPPMAQHTNPHEETREQPHEDPRTSKPRPAQEGPGWTTRLRLALPSLGEVDAALGLNASGVDLRVTASDPRARAQLRAGRIALVRRLEAAGLVVRACQMEGA